MFQTPKKISDNSSSKITKTTVRNSQWILRYDAPNYFTDLFSLAVNIMHTMFERYTYMIPRILYDHLKIQYTIQNALWTCNERVYELLKYLQLTSQWFLLDVMCVYVLKTPSLDKTLNTSSVYTDYRIYKYIVTQGNNRIFSTFCSLSNEVFLLFVIDARKWWRRSRD